MAANGFLASVVRLAHELRRGVTSVLRDGRQPDGQPVILTLRQQQNQRAYNTALSLFRENRREAAARSFALYIRTVANGVQGLSSIETHLAQSALAGEATFVAHMNRLLTEYAIE